MKIPIFAVIDTSVIISAFMSPTNGGASYAILENYIQKKTFVWLMSPALYDEYLQKLAVKFEEIQKRAAKKGIHIEAKDIDNVLSILADTCRWMDTPIIIHGITADPNDDHIGTLAAEAGVNYLVTLDNDFTPMKQGGYTVEIVRPSDFIQLLRLAS